MWFYHLVSVIKMFLSHPWKKIKWIATQVTPSSIGGGGHRQVTFQKGELEKILITEECNLDNILHPSFSKLSAK